MARGEGVDRGGGPGGRGGGIGGVGAGGGGRGSVGAGSSGLSERGPGAGGVIDRSGGDISPGGFGPGGERDVGGRTDVAPGGFGSDRSSDGQIKGNIQPGSTAGTAAFDAFREQTSGVIGTIESFLGLGPQVGALALEGAKAADPTAVTAGQKTGVALEAAAAVSSLTANLPARALVSVIDRLTTAISDPAFSVGRLSVENQLEGVSGIAGAVAGIATRSIGVAKAVELGINLGGVALAAERAGFEGGPADAPSGGTGRETQRRSISEEGVLAVAAPLIETGTEEATAQRRTLVSRRNLGRSSLRVKRVENA
jgi:hypothetical protein